MPSTSGTDIYVKFDGVDGESTDSGHKDWSVVTSLSHNIEQPSASTTTSGDVTTGRASHHDFTLTKHLDKATPKLHEICCTGKVLPKVDIDVMRSAGDKPVKVYTIHMEKVVLAKITFVTNDDTDRPGETIGCRYGSIAWTYNTGNGNTSSGFNVAENKKI